MNKKGQLFKYILGALMLIVIALIAFTSWFPQIITAGKNVGDVLAKDFDGDNKASGFASEFNDPCPCGVDNVKKTIGGKDYCIADFNPSCGCLEAQKIANKEKEGVHFFVSEGRCAYTDDGCKYLRTQDFDFMDKLASGALCPGTG